MTLSAAQIAGEPGPFGTDDLELGAAEGYKLKASRLRRCGEVRCCIRGCGSWLPRRSGTDRPKFCPDHGISISTSPTYVYRDWKRNFLLRHDLIARVKEHKVESWRLGNESSEDALSWNMFVGLAHVGGLPEAFELLMGQQARADPQLFFWGVEVWPAYRGVWSRLADARKRCGEESYGIPTEPDIMLRVEGQAIVLVEAKFGSPNGTLAKKKPPVDVPTFLDRYPALPGRTDPLDRAAMTGMQRDQVMEQLCRNVMFASYLADGGEGAFVANVVRGAAEMDIKDRMDRHLCSGARASFRRVAWEDLARLPAMYRDEAAPLKHYMRTKTLRLQPAFNI